MWKVSQYLIIGYAVWLSADVSPLAGALLGWAVCVLIVTVHHWIWHWRRGLPLPPNNSPHWLEKTVTEARLDLCYRLAEAHERSRLDGCLSAKAATLATLSACFPKEDIRRVPKDPFPGLRVAAEPSNGSTSGLVPKDWL
jgi:hypothetical protein